MPLSRRGWRLLLLGLALAAGVVYSFPHWWWQFTAPEYSVVRGYVLSDDDIAPYTAALRDAATYGLPPLVANHRSYETRGQFFYPALSIWLTSLALGGLLRLLGSFELLVPVGLFLSGAATFLLFYALAQRLLAHRAGALLIAVFACFRYPFYISAITFARRLLQGGGPQGLAAAARAAFPGMVNGYMLYPYVRWPVPGMVFWWFLLALLFVFALARWAWDRPARPVPWRAALGLGLWVGLAAYVYFFFWSYLMVLLALLAGAGWLMRQRGLAVALAGAAFVAVLVSAPFLLGAARIIPPGAGGGAAVGATVIAPAGFQVRPASAIFETLLIALSTHGALALAVLFLPGLVAAGPGANPGRVVLFGMHLTVVLLAGVELNGFRGLQAWHWSRHMLDCLAPLTAGWLLLLWQRRAPGGGGVNRWPAGVAGLAVVLAAFVAAAGAGQPVQAGGFQPVARTVAALVLLAPVAVALTARPGSRPLLVGALLLTALTWYFFHRTVSEMSWLAFLPLAGWTASRRPQALKAALVAFAGLNVALAAALQVAVRPAAARPFFTQPQAVTEGLRWLAANTAPESVVMTDGWLSDSVVRAYTPDLTYTQPHWWTNVPINQRYDRLLLRAATFGTPPELLAEWDAAVSENVSEFKRLVNEEWIGDERLGYLPELQTAFPFAGGQYAQYAEMPLEQLLAVYRVDYLWAGPWEQYSGRRNLDAAPALMLVYENDLVRVYAVRRDALP